MIHDALKFIKICFYLGLIYFIYKEFPPKFNNPFDDPLQKTLAQFEFFAIGSLSCSFVVADIQLMIQARKPVNILRNGFDIFIIFLGQPYY